MDRLRAVHNKALKIIQDRETSYRNRWEAEPIAYLWTNIWRKASGLESMINGGATDQEKIKEDLLDLVNAASMVYARMVK